MKAKNKKITDIWKYIFSAIILIIGITPFYINSHALTEHIYGGQIFYTDMSRSILLGYTWVLTYFLLGLSIFLVINFFIKKYITNYRKIENFFAIDYNKNNIIKNSILIFFISFCFKLLLYDFNLDFGDASKILNNYEDGSIFDVYKLYTLVVVMASSIFIDYNIVLGLFNISISSLSMSIYLLLLFKVNKSFALNNIILLTIIFYLPLNAIDSMFRIDALYFFLFTLTIYLVVKLSDPNNKRVLSYLLLVLFLSCIAREQTLYILPLLLLYLIFIKIPNKKIVITSIIFVVVSTSLYLSSYNYNKYNINSLFKNRILVIAAMQYGYLNPSIMKLYENKLSNNAKNLLQDINNSYKKNILPSKRQSFYTEEKSILWTYIRPDYENVYIKNNLFNISTKENFLLAKNKLIKELNNSKKYISLKDLDNISKQSQNNHNSSLANIKSLIINDFYNDGTGLGHYKHVYKACDDLTDSKLNRDCLIKVLENITYDYYHTRHDNAFYTKAALEVASNYDKESKKYIKHDNIGYINEILLSRPAMYITQSMLTGLSMTGYVPVPSSMTARFSEVYTTTILPGIFLYDFQKLYYLPINFWYIFCFLSFLLTLFFHKENSEKSLSLFLSFIPLYYGAFISFANFAEFSRLMLPIIPLIMYNFIKLYQKAPVAVSLIFILPTTYMYITKL